MVLSARRCPDVGQSDEVVNIKKFVNETMMLIVQESFKEELQKWMF